MNKQKWKNQLVTHEQQREKMYDQQQQMICQAWIKKIQ
jgi:hypothetical protein